MPNNQQGLAKSTISTKTLTKIQYCIKKQAYLESLKRKYKPKKVENIQNIKKISFTLGWIRTHAHRYRDHGMKENIRRFNDLDCKS